MLGYEWAINFASRYGHIQVLEWFKNSGYKFKYDQYAIYGASEDEHNKILEFFKNCNVKKVIKWYEPLKFKTKNNYINEYNKN